jgi:hypothetical protein
MSNLDLHLSLSSSLNFLPSLETFHGPFVRARSQLLARFDAPFCHHDSTLVRALSSRGDIYGQYTMKLVRLYKVHKEK